MTARILPPSFAFDQEGQLYIARGDRNVQRWNGVASSFADAGVPAPSAAPTISSNTGGTIVGRLYAYQRWLDADGRVSNLSPVSSVHTVSVSTGTITAATNASPIVITSASHGLSNNDTVKIVDVLGNSNANGRWTVSSVTTNTFTLTGSAGNGAYVSGGTWYKGASTIAYSGITVPTDSRVVKRQILRNKDGDVKTFYVDVEDMTLSGTTFNSTKTDSQLTTAVPLVDLNGNDLALRRHGEPPNWKRFIVHHKGRMWLAGQWNYREGGIALTNGSATVTGLGTNWTSAMVGWELFPAGSTTSYTVTAVGSATSLTIEANYAGTTDPYAEYTLTPPVFNSQGGAERRTVYCSEAGLPGSFDRSKALTLPEEKDAGEITGLISYNNVLMVAFERKLTRIAYAVRPAEDGQAFTALYRGLVNQRCAVDVDGMLYLMDRRGCYAYTGGQDEDISQPIRPIFDGTDDRWRINWRDVDYFHAAHYAEEATVKWFVILDGGVYPRHALCYHYRRQRWWIEEYPEPILASCTGDYEGRQVVYLSLPGRRVVMAGGTPLDGVSTGSTTTLRGTATAAGLVTLTDSTAAFTAAVVGVPVVITGGTGVGQRRIIVSRTATVLTVDQPWTVLPDTTSTYQVGGIPWRWLSGWFRWAPVRSGSQAPRALHLEFEPTDAASRMAINQYANLSATALEAAMTQDLNGVATTADSADYVVDTTQAEGYVRHEIGDAKEIKAFGKDKTRIGLSGVPNAERQEVYGVIVEGAV